MKAAPTVDELAAFLLTDEMSCWVYAPDYLTYPGVAEALGEPCLPDVDASRRAAAQILATGLHAYLSERAA